MLRFTRVSDLNEESLTVTGEGFDTIYCCNERTRHAETGSGPYYTRYIRWHTLIRSVDLPKIRLGEIVAFNNDDSSLNYYDVS